MFNGTTNQNAFQDIHVEGDFSFKGSFTQVGQQTIVQERPDFDTVSLAEYKPDVFKGPPITPHLVAHLNNPEKRFLVLWGNPAIDTEALAKHVAACLLQMLAAGAEETEAKVWRRTGHLLAIESELQKTEKPTVLILPQLGPEHIGFDLMRLKRTLKRKNVYVVISTDIPFEAWRQPESVKPFWYDVNPKDVAGYEHLFNEYSEEESVSNWYHQKLSPRERLIALGLRFFDGLPDNQFFAALDVIVEKVWQRRDASLRALDYCDLERLHNFFKFTGMENGAVIEISSSGWRNNLFKSAWKSDRRQILSVLPVLAGMVKDSVQENSENPELFGTLRKRYQIRLAVAGILCDLGALSVSAVQATLVNLSAHRNIDVRHTAAYVMANWRHSRYQLDEQLFSILHQWTDLTGSQEVISQAAAGLKERVTENAQQVQAENHLKATVLLTIGYASQYDPPMNPTYPDGLAPELFDLLKKLALETAPVVRSALLEHTLPTVLRFHLPQLRGWVYELAASQRVQHRQGKADHDEEIFSFCQGVGQSLASAYPVYPEETLTLLETWTEEGLPSAKQQPNLQKITSRERLLATVVFAYASMEGALEPTGSLPLTPEAIFERLHALLKNEKHPFVRRAILSAIQYQAWAFGYFTRIEPQLQSLVTQVKESEWDAIVALLASIYFHQRILQTGGDYLSPQKTTRSGHKTYQYRYQIWTVGERPHTEIEQTMYYWLQNDRNRAAQQIATRSLVAFVEVLDQEEDQEKENILKQQAEETAPSAPQSSPRIRATPRDFYVIHVVPWVTILLKWMQYALLKGTVYPDFVREFFHYRRLLGNILPEALKLDSSSHSNLILALKKLTKQPEQKIITLADLLKTAMKLAHNPQPVLIGIGLVILSLFVLLYTR